MKIRADAKEGLDTVNWARTIFSAVPDGKVRRCQLSCSSTLATYLMSRTVQDRTREAGCCRLKPEAGEALVT
jgi:hypothetical protein